MIPKGLLVVLLASTLLIVPSISEVHSSSALADSLETWLGTVSSFGNDILVNSLRNHLRKTECYFLRFACSEITGRTKLATDCLSQESVRDFELQFGSVAERALSGSGEHDDVGRDSSVLYLGRNSSVSCLSQIHDTCLSLCCRFQFDF